MASILETFFIMFESNSDQLKKGQEGAKKSSKDLEDQLSRTDRQAKALGDSFLNMVKEAGAAIVAGLAVEKIYEGVKAEAELNAQLGLTAERLDVNIEDLGAWGEAAKRSGGSMDGLISSLDFLNKNMAAVEAGGQSRLKPFFEHLKIQTLDAHKKVRPLFEILGDLADRFSKMGKQEVAGFGEKLGLDPGTVMMLQQGRRGVEDIVARMKSLGVTTKEDAETAHKFNLQVEDMDQQFRHVYTTIGSWLLPGLTSFLKWIHTTVGYLTEHKTAVEGFFIGVAGIITYLYLPAMIRAAAATWAAIGPYVLIIAAVLALAAAFALVYDDVMNFLAGNQSVIGELSKKWPWIGETVRAVVTGIGEAFRWTVDLIRAEVDTLVALFHFLVASVQLAGRLISGAWNTATTFVEEKINALVKRFPLLGLAFHAVGEIFKVVGRAIVDVFQWIIDKITHVAELYKWFTGGLKAATVAISTIAAHPAAADPGHALAAGKAAHVTAADTGHALAQGKAAIHTANVTPFAARPGTVRQGDKHYHITVGDVHIEGSQVTDAESAGRTVGHELEKHLRQAINHVDDGVQA